MVKFQEIPISGNYVGWFYIFRLYALFLYLNQFFTTANKEVFSYDNYQDQRKCWKHTKTCANQWVRWNKKKHLFNKETKDNVFLRDFYLMRHRYYDENVF